MPAPAFMTRHARAQVTGQHSVPFTHAATAKRGLFKTHGDIVEDGAGMERAQTVTMLVVMSDDGPWVRDARVTFADSTVFEIREALPIEDGVTTRLYLAPVTS